MKEKRHTNLVLDTLQDLCWGRLRHEVKDVLPVFDEFNAQSWDFPQLNVACSRSLQNGDKITWKDLNYVYHKRKIQLQNCRRGNKKPKRWNKYR